MRLARFRRQRKKAQGFALTSYVAVFKSVVPLRNLATRIYLPPAVRLETVMFTFHRDFVWPAETDVAPVANATP